MFNKLGDLYLKTNSVQAAVETYERAADLYEKSGFPNNAIALCNKILRNAPGRTAVYLKLAKLMMQRGFIAEAKTNLLEYAERMQKAGQVEQAFKALKNFADMSPENEEIRLLLAEQLKAAARTDEAREQLAKLYAEVEAEGDEGRARSTLTKLKAIDPKFDPEGAPRPQVAQKKQKSTDLVFLDLDDSPAPAPEPAAPSLVEPEPEPEPVEALDIETTSLVEEEVEEEAIAEAPTLETEEMQIERASAEYLAVSDDVETVPGLDAAATLDEGAGPPALEIETTVLDDSLETVVAGRASEATDLEVPDLDLSVDVDEPAPQPAGSGAFSADALDFDAGGAVEAPPPPTLEELERQVAENPDDPGMHRALGEALIEQGDRQRGLEELNHALAAAEGQGDWDQAEAMADEIIRLDPASVRHHQKRVEYAYRRNDKNHLVRAYLSLANALFRQGQAERARAVYQRVLEHDASNADALEALATLAPEPASAGPAQQPTTPAGPPAAATADAGSFVDLGAMVLEEDGPKVKDTRMRIEEEEPTGDEERDFAEMLTAFKKGIQENVAEEDWQAHYDLGIAFKEMGLLDEAIGEFQKALKSPDGRLRSAEALGNCFFEKGQFSVAATVLKRAVDSDARGDDEKIGLLYLVGRAEEEQGRIQQALDFYQRVFAIDIDFQDVSDRVKSLASVQS